MACTSVLVGVRLCGGAAWAQDLTGKWTATALSNNVAVTLDLKVAGNQQSPVARDDSR
jgi:hypothetical protein